MLSRDLTTVRRVFEKKRQVKMLLKQTSRQCRSGLWYIGGAYARHHNAALPQPLNYAVHDVWVRKRERQLVEWLSPPWCAFVGRRSRPDAIGDCSIGYLSHDGDWKLFDTTAKKIWAPVRGFLKLEKQQRIREVFSRGFNIPAWRVIKKDGMVWWLDDYIEAGNLAGSGTPERVSVTGFLIGQYAVHARQTATAPDPQTTSKAIDAIRECAPTSRFAQLVARHEDGLRALGCALKSAPAHGDLGAQNILVLGRKPWLIDWNGAGRQMPVLYDVSYLMISEALRHRSDLLEALLGGTFDHDLDALFRAGGCCREKPNRMLGVIHSMLIHFYEAEIAGRLNMSELNSSFVWDRLSNSYIDS